MKMTVSAAWRACRSLKRVIGEGEELAEPELRNLLKVSAGVFFYLTAAGLAGLIGNFALRSESGTRAPQWLKMGRKSEIGREPKSFLLTFSEKDGWHTRERRRVVYSFLNEEGGIVVLSAVCSHLACTVRWNQQSRHFECPCHGGLFDPHGRVLAGPPTRPLSSLPWKMENEEILVKTA